MRNLFTEIGESQLDDASRSFEDFDSLVSPVAAGTRASCGGIRETYWNAGVEAVAKLLRSDQSIQFGLREQLVNNAERLKRNRV